MSGRWIVQTIASLINSDTNPPNYFVGNTSARHYRDGTEAEVECARLNAKEAAAEKLRQSCSWIPVSERLPDDRCQVLVWVSDGFWLMAYYGRSGWREACVSEKPVYRVTHWMELPKGPEGMSGSDDVVDEILLEVVNRLCKTDRGLSSMAAVLSWMDDIGLGLDYQNKRDIIMLIRLIWDQPGTARDLVRERFTRE